MMELDWTQILLGVIAVLGVIFGSTGFWAFITERKHRSDDVAKKVDIIVEDVQVLKDAHEDSLQYRQLREEKEKLEAAARNADIELLKKADAVIMEHMLLENYERVKRTGVYTISQRSIYSTMFRVYKSLHYDGRMNQIWENIRTFPDEDGITHHITDKEREEISAL